MAASIVTVISSDHSHHVAVALRNLWDTKRETDFDLRWNGATSRAHRVILELFLSPEMIGTDADRRHAVCQVKKEVPGDSSGGSHNVLDSVIEFLYKGEVSVPEDELPGLLRVARELDFKMLVEAIVPAGGERANPATQEERIGCSEDDGSSGSEIGDESEILSFGANKNLTITPCFVNLERRVTDDDQDMPSGSSDSIYKHGPSHSSEIKSEPDEGVTVMVDPMIVQSMRDDGSANSDDSAPRRPAADPNFSPASAEKSKAAKIYKCPHCEYESPTYHKYHFHLSSVHGLTPRGTPAPTSRAPKTTKLYKCPKCSFETTKYITFYQHRLEIHGQAAKGKPAQRYNCVQCAFETLSYSTYNIHLGSVHGVTAKGDPAPQHKCPHCEFVTPRYSRYHHHLLSTHGLTVRGEPAPKHTCTECSFSSVFLSKLTKHLKTTHSHEKRHACQHCSYMAKEKSTLKIHLNVVHGEGDSRYTCSLCGQRCGCRTDLERHYQCHASKGSFEDPTPDASQ